MDIIVALWGWHEIRVRGWRDALNACRAFDGKPRAATFRDLRRLPLAETLWHEKGA